MEARHVDPHQVPIRTGNMEMLKGHRYNDPVPYPALSPDSDSMVPRHLEY